MKRAEVRTIGDCMDRIEELFHELMKNLKPEVAGEDIIGFDILWGIYRRVILDILKEEYGRLKE